MATPASITFPTYEENFPESSRVLTGRRRGAVKTKTIPSQVSDPASSSKYQRGRNRGAQTERVSRRLETKLVSKYANITTKVRRNDSDSQDDIFITPNVKNAHSQSGAKHTPARSRLYTTPRAQANVKTTGIQHQRKPRHDHAAAVLSTLKAQKNKDLLRSLYKPELIDLVAASEKSTKLRNSLLRSTQQGQHTQHGQTKPATFSSTVSVYDNANSSLVDESVALDSISRRMVALSAAAPNDPALQSSPLVHALSAPLYTNLKPVSGMDRAQLVIEVNHMRRERVEQEREQVKLHIRVSGVVLFSVAVHDVVIVLHLFMLYTWILK